LIKVLGFNNPAVGAVATQGLIALGRDVVPILLVSLDVGNYGARAWVIRAIATLRDPRGLDLLEHALNADIAPAFGAPPPVGWPRWSSKVQRLQGFLKVL
jgi:phycocyanobilin lyase beta subunit